MKYDNWFERYSSLRSYDYYQAFRQRGLGIKIDRSVNFKPPGVPLPTKNGYVPKIVISRKTYDIFFVYEASVIEHQHDTLRK